MDCASTIFQTICLLERGKMSEEGSVWNMDRKRGVGGGISPIGVKIMRVWPAFLREWREIWSRFGRYARISNRNDLSHGVDGD